MIMMVVNIHTKEEKLFATFAAAMEWLNKQENKEDFRITSW